MSKMDFCQECGSPCAVPSDLIPTDVGMIHRGECHMRFTANLETIDLTQRLWAAVSLWDLQKPILVELTVPSKPTGKSKAKVLGVIVDHLVPDGDEPEAWVLEDNAGNLHQIPVVLEMAVKEDAWAA